MTIQKFTHLEDALIDGSNKVKSGKVRQWHGVKATGNVRTNTQYEMFTEVIDPNAGHNTRWLNMGSLSGKIVLSDGQVQTWEKGAKVNTEKPQDTQSAENETEVIQRYFNMTDKQLVIFLVNSTEKTIAKLTDKCKL